MYLYTHFQCTYTCTMYMYMYIPRWVRQKTWLFWASLLLSYLTLYKHLWLYTCIYVHVDSNSKTYQLVPPPSLKVGPARDFEWDQRLEWSGVECLDYASAQSPWVYTRKFAIRYLYTEHASRIHRVNVYTSEIPLPCNTLRHSHQIYTIRNIHQNYTICKNKGEMKLQVNECHFYSACT